MEWRVGDCVGVPVLVLGGSTVKVYCAFEVVPAFEYGEEPPRPSRMRDVSGWEGSVEAGEYALVAKNLANVDGGIGGMLEFGQQEERVGVCGMKAPDGCKDGCAVKVGRVFEASTVKVSWPRSESLCK